MSSSWGTQISSESVWSGDNYLFAGGSTLSKSEESSDFVCAPVSRERMGRFSKHVPGAEMVVPAQHHSAPWAESLLNSSKAWVGRAWPLSPSLLSQTAHSSVHRVVLMRCRRDAASFSHPAPLYLCSTSPSRPRVSPFWQVLPCTRTGHRAQDRGARAHRGCPSYLCFPVC